MKRALLALAVGISASMSAYAGPFIEGFDNVASLAGKGWTVSNNSTPGPGSSSWFQGNVATFSSQSGAANSYVSANFNSVVGEGVLPGFINTTIATPFLSMSATSKLTFWMKGSTSPGYTDHFGVFLQTGDVTGPITQIIADTEAVSDWTMYSIFLPGLGDGATGRIGFNYFGDVLASDTIGLDTLSVEVPEPAGAALFGVAMLGLLIGRRKAVAKS